jgi:hypothetical protein
LVLSEDIEGKATKRVRTTAFKLNHD